MHPIMFTIPGINMPIYSYGVMLGLSLVVGWYIVMWLGKKDGLPVEKMGSCFMWTAIAAMIGARVLYVVANLKEFEGADLIDIVNVRRGGLVAYGGFLGGFVGSWIYLWRQRIRLLPWADVVVPTLATGLGITRVGCLLYGCDYGKPIPADAPAWLKAIAITFPNWNVKFADLAERMKDGGMCMAQSFTGSPAFHQHVNLGLVKITDAASLPVYPTQIMEIANGWIAFGLVMLVKSRTKFRGQAFLFFTAYYGLTRFLMEFLRGDTQRGGVGAISTSQIIGLSTLLLSLVFSVILYRKAKADPVAAMALGPGAVEPAGGAESTKTTAVRRKKRK
ncbi:MAG: prolipoprotein diacylglyceryl transferase [Deltaproteobacteria bacterium]|nr:prolipoprotein diacylglyceryl transferase [Deltaproteobacteria bacterium]